MLTNEEIIIAKLKYKQHCYNVEGVNRIDRLGNPIKMRLTFEEWLNIWVVSGHWHERGNKLGQYVMSRISDIGHYEINNVEIKTNSENHIESRNLPKWRASNQAMHKSPEFQAKMKAVRDSAEYKEKVKLGREKMKDNLEWRLNQKIGAKTRSANPIWQQNHKLVHCKPISCDGIIYESKKAAALNVAPSDIRQKQNWLSYQMKKYPERYYYIKDTE